MTRFVVAACAALGLAGFAPARAQFTCGPLCGPGYRFGGYSYSFRSGFGFSVGGPHFRVSGFSGGFVTRAAYFAPPLVPVAPFGPFGPVGFVPAYPGPFGFGPTVVVAPPVVLGGGFVPDFDLPAAAVPPRNDAVVFPRGAKESDFLVIAPRRGAIPEVPRVAARGPGPRIDFDPFREPVRVEQDRPDPDPKKEAARQVALARAAFAAGDYGRAADHFERASTSDPADARLPFLRAQALFASGQYADAVARIRDGLGRDPKWPASGFDPAEVYGGHPDRYAAHLDALKKAVTDNTGQPVLEFLLGYQLWFGGARVEAEKLFRAAEKRLTAPGPIGLFK